MAQRSTPSEIAKLSFEDALKELEDIVRRLEAGSAKLDDALAAYERGALLKQHCESKLREAQARVDKIVLGSDGKPATEPMALE
ncbi:MAG: exodeoxyribonuclease VII small subunit [Alphaproteobacteria bacterium]|jgi:exodeoxyribonuclease VII small subunit|nr:exodeoxyribonuclease VII small subunit [Alphaproteobacteria bacterium]MDE1968544.1 exodeoxyribonuclease VII small subunit [Alphaproteobacteria bacterium]MDE2513264.1 exodeoxyribonuclease VII small subunit [Alphaproteobacteria bacterium]